MSERFSAGNLQEGEPFGSPPRWWRSFIPAREPRSCQILHPWLHRSDRVRSRPAGLHTWDHNTLNAALIDLTTLRRKGFLCRRIGCTQTADFAWTAHGGEPGRIALSRMSFTRRHGKPRDGVATTGHRRSFTSNRSRNGPRPVPVATERRNRCATTAGLVASRLCADGRQRLWWQSLLLCSQL